MRDHAGRSFRITGRGTKIDADFMTCLCELKLSGLLVHRFNSEIHVVHVFRDFLREPELWPDCHILLGAQVGTDAADLLHDLKAEYPGGACVYTLGEMDLAAETERRRLVSFLHAQPQLRALENVDDVRVLKLVGGYPRVISRWTAEDARDTATTFDGLARLAKDANEFRYRDLEKLLIDLDGDRRKLAARIALVPLVENADAWRVLRPIILANLDPNALDDLKLTNVLDNEAGSPKFGHPTRRDAARAFLYARRWEAVRTEAESLILALARSVTAIDASTIVFIAALGPSGGCCAAESRFATSGFVRGGA